MFLAALALVYILSWFGALYGLPELAEHELQLFMASHYASTPFSLWDVRWYGGFDVAWRPPGFYVLAAIGAPLVGLERSYALLVIATAVALVLASAWLAQRRAPRHAAAIALFVALNPLVYLTIFSLGQAPFVAALVAALIVAAATAEGMLPLAAGATVLAPLFHPLGWPLALLAIFTRLQLRRVLVLLLALAASVAILWPLLRTINAGGGGPVAHDKAWLLASLCACAALAFVPRARALAALGLLASTYILGDHAHAAPERRYREAVASVEAVLSRPEAGGFRYLTLGLGNERLALSRRAHALLADGAIPWHTRTLSGARIDADAIDALPLATAEGQQALGTVLADAEGRSLRWIVAATTAADGVLQGQGYRIAAAFSGGVVLWEKDVAPMQETAAPAANAHVWTLATPLMLLFCAASVVAREARRRSSLRSASLQR